LGGRFSTSKPGANVESVVGFFKTGGKSALITRLEIANDAVQKKAGMGI
jgi:carbamate kinase